MTTHVLKLTAHQAEELRYKLDVVAETDDLVEDYGLTVAQIEELSASIPARGDWAVPDWAVELIREEADSIAIIRTGQSQDLVDGKEYAACRRDVRAFTKIVEQLS